MATDAGLLAREGGITLSEAAAGFVLGTSVAFALATVMAWSRPLERTLFPLAILVKLTPIVAIAPLITFFPMLVNSFVGLRSADLQEVAFLETLGASGREIFQHLRVPSALPYLFSGARISLNLALIGAVIGEWTGADRGLGRVIFVANANLDLTILFGAVLVLAAIGIAANAVVGAAERRVLHWHPIAVAT